MEIDLKDIIKRCKAHDHGAFEVLYKKYYRVLLGIALRYTRTEAEAEDVLQDAFIKIFNSIGTFEMKGSFEGWIKRIVQNTAINNYRSSLRFGLHVDISDHEDLANNEAVDAALDVLDARYILHLLNSMPDGYRTILNLYMIDGYSHKEISEMLNITVGTSKSQLFKAKNYLKELIETKDKQII